MLLTKVFKALVTLEQFKFILMIKIEKKREEKAQNSNKYNMFLLICLL